MAREGRISPRCCASNMGSHGNPRVEEQNRELQERFQELEGRNRELEERNRELEDETGRPRTAAESATDNSNVSFGLPMDLSQNMGAASNTNWLIDTGSKDTAKNMFIRMYYLRRRGLRRHGGEYAFCCRES